MQGSQTRGRFVDLQNVVDNLWTKAIAPSTRQSYETGFQTYIRFLLLTGTIAYVTDENIPVSEDLLMYFVAHCSSRLVISYSTIKLYLCGIKFKCLENNIKYPELSNLGRLKNILNGVKREQVKKLFPRYPITFDILKKCVYGYVRTDVIQIYYLKQSA